MIPLIIFAVLLTVYLVWDFLSYVVMGESTIIQIIRSVYRRLFNKDVKELQRSIRDLKVTLSCQIDDLSCRVYEFEREKAKERFKKLDKKKLAKILSVETGEKLTSDCVINYNVTDIKYVLYPGSQIEYITFERAEKLIKNYDKFCKTNKKRRK